MKTKPDFRLLIDVDNQRSFGDSYLTFNARVVVSTDEGLRNPVWSFSADSVEELAGLAVHAQLTSYKDVCDRDDFYGRDVCYEDMYNVDLRHCESMVKVLRRIHNRLRALDDRLGYPEDLAAFMGRVAVAIGCPENMCFSHGTSGDYHWMDVDALRWFLKSRISEWKEANNLRDHSDA